MKIGFYVLMGAAIGCFCIVNPVILPGQQHGGPNWAAHQPASVISTLKTSAGGPVFTLEAQPAANLDQYRNGAFNSPNNTCTNWVNGNAGEQNSHYVEGWSIPYRCVMTDLPLNTAITLSIGYDIRNSGKNGLDYLTYFQRMSPHDNFCDTSHHNPECVTPAAGGFSTYPIPAPSSAGSPVPGMPTNSFNGLPSGERLMRLYGGVIDSIYYGIQGNLTANQSETVIKIIFHATSSTATLAWGGHIASRQDWGDGNSASGINGSPYHMRLKTWSLGSLGNMDRSLSAAAVAPKCVINGPLLVCSGTTRQFCVSNQTGINYSWTISGGGAVIVGKTDSSCVNVKVGNGNFSIGVTLSGGNTGFCSTCSLPVTVEPAIACAITGPDTLCPAASVQYCAPAGAGAYAWSVSGSAVIVGASDQACVSVLPANNCNSSFTLSLSVGSPTCGGSCTKTVVIKDAVPPALSCPPNRELDCGVAAIPGNTGTALATDNCSGSLPVSFFDEAAPANCTGQAGINRRWKAVDACGNIGSCVQSIVYKDVVAPVITCPANAVLECGASSQPANTGTASATDNCDSAPVITYADEPVAANCTGQAGIKRTWKATDGCGNTATCVQMISFQDTIPPMVSCLGDQDLPCGAPTQPAFTGFATASDNCDAVPVITYVDSPLPANCTGQAGVQRTWTATDACGNTATHVQLLTFKDLSVPVLTCPADKQIECGTLPIPANTGMATATDNCGGIPVVSYTDEAIAANCTGLAGVKRTWKATDACGNSTTHVQLITYKDLSAPVVICPANQQIACGASILPVNTGAATATDNCGGIPVLSYTDEALPANCTGQMGVKRSWKATDACGNSATCVQTIVVTDNAPPQISGPTDKALICGASALPANTGTATATDNCGAAATVTYTDAPLAAGCTGQAGIQRTWKATDACGNSATYVQKIEWIDTLPPVITCPANKALACGASAAPANTGTANATDNCGGVPAISYTDVADAANCNGQAGIQRIWKATDACGNTATCVQVISFVDQVAPVISCPANRQLDCDASSNPDNTGLATATDNCGGQVAITYTDIMIAANCTGRAGIKRVWKATDACGNTATCTQTIVFKDNTPPVLSVTNSVEITCGVSATPANTGGATATDNCGGVPALTYTDEAITANCTGQAGVKRTWKAIDACGNSTTAVQTIVYKDQAPPEIACPTNKQVECGAATLPANTGTATATDNCGGLPTVTYTDEATAANCTGQAGIKRIWKATDACGNTTTCNQTIVYVDNTPPVISCNGDKQLTCGASSAPANTGTATATDNCGGTVAVTYTDESIAANCTGQAGIKRTWKATDACGNSATTVQTIVYVDNTPPVISCSGDKQLTCGASSAPANTGTATATDNCGGTPTITYTDESIAANCTGQAGINRTWKATDACGNSATTVQTIVYVDNTPPVISCSGDKQLTCGASSAPANTGTATATDNCGGIVAITYTDEALAANCTGQAGIKRTWKATDACGNTATTVQTIVYVDNTPPVISCSGDKQLTCGASSAPANTGTATATDNCGGTVAVTYTDESIATNCTGQAGIKRTWKATDACGNSATTVQTIVYVDNTPPVISCSGDKLLTCGASSAPANTGTATATDNCGGTVAITYTDESIAANCTGQAGIKRTWKATDACGNSATTVQTIVYVDNTPPVISCSGDKQLTCGASAAPANTGTATATDNCGGTVAVTYTDEALAANCTGQAGIKRTWKATDACGNSATTVQTIVYVDNTPPVISCSGDKQLTCGASSAPANTGTATATDNCGGIVAITYTDEALAANCTGQAGIKRTWKATDACGNSATTVQTIVYVDNTPPAISNPGDKQLTCGASSAPANTGTATATDNCGGTVTVTYTDEALAANCTGQAGIKRTWKATDACGNSATTVQTIVYVDNTPPAVSNPGDKQLTCGASSAPANTGTATATDNCGGTVTVTYTDEALAANCTGQAGIKRTWKATDACGNSATTVQTIVYVDNTPPVISCNGDKQLTCGASAAPANTGTATATDNCGGTPTITYTDEALAANCTGQAGIKRTWKATDACGNSATTVQTIVYVDNTPPAVSNPGDKQLTCGASSAPANTGTATATDNCGGTVAVTYTDEALAANCTGQAGIKRTWKATDACGNTATTVQTIVYVDNTPPVISCNGDKQLPCGASSAPANTGTATATDNCGGTVTVTYTDEALAANCTGQAGIKRTWKATDACGNSATTVQTIVYVDNTPPVISCSGDKQLTCGASSAPANTGTATATDNCGGTPTITYTDESIAANCTGQAGIKRTWKATDACGNSATTVQMIVYVDNTPPVISCTGDKQLTCGASSAPANTGTATATDNCGSTIAITYTDETLAANCTGQAGIKRTWKATDACGNSATTVQMIVYVDNTPPVISCNGDKQLTCGASSAPANTGTATATDNCGGTVAVTYTDETLAANCTGQAGIKRTWKATDACGNSATTVQTIVYVDNTPPVISCNGDKQLTCGASSAPANTGTATATDNCGGTPVITYTDESIAANCTGQAGIKRTWKATDACGNSATTVQMIVYVDNTPPVISCTGDKQLTCGASSAPANTGTATATDNCGGTVAVTYTDESLAANCTGQAGIKRTWKATDACGNSATTVQTIVYVDNTPPVISCNGDKQLTCGASSAPANTGTATATDNCGGTVAVTYTDESLAANCTGQAGIKRTWKATDACGNSATTVQMIVYVDNTPPVISCSGDKQLTCGASSAPANTGTATATDNCGGTPVITYTDESIAANCTGQAGIKRTWKATDACGNSVTTVQTIVYVDNTPPVISCSGDKQLTCGASSAPANTGSATATDNCGGTVAVTYTDESIAANCTGQAGIKRTWKATDACGNSATTVQTIVYVDNTPPVISCSGDKQLTCGASSAPANTGTATDNCGGTPVITYTDESLAANCTGQAGIKRTWKATDACGNSATTVQTIVYVDNTPPVISCNGDKQLTCGASSAPANTGTATATDNCGGTVAVTYTDETLAANCTGQAGIKRTWKATDACGNSATTVQTIVYVDNTPPVISCSGDKQLTCGASSAPANTGTATATDNCGGTPVITYTDESIAANCTGQAGIKRTWKATDACGNSATTVQTIVYVDNTPPVISCNGDKQLTCGASSAPANTGTATATDNCGGTVAVTYTDESIAANCTGQAGIKRTWKATDACGNSATTVQTIVYVDNTPPVISCNGDKQLTCGASSAPANTGTATATDNCGGTVAVTYTDESIAANCTGQAGIKRTWKATDACGNSATTVQMIVYVDNTPPVISCNGDKQLTCGASSAPANTGTATATDNCGGTVAVTYTDESIAANCTGQAGIKRTWKATDACGNSATTVQTIVYVDNTPPVISCNGDKQLTCGASSDPANTGTATATDNCGGTVAVTYTDETLAANCTGQAGIKRTWKATDACGNSATTVQTIVYVDNTPPAISNPGDKQLTCGASSAPANTGTATATDNCGGTVAVTYTDETLAANCTGQAGIKRTWKATDACGNSATTVQTIVYVDNTPPVISCSGDKQLTCGASSAPANTGTATATDNCGGAVAVTYIDESLAANCTGQVGIKRTWKATDACGNSATTVHTIVYVDNTPPAISNPGDKQLTCGASSAPANTGTATATDNCGGTVAVTYTDESIAANCTGQAGIKRTWKATDACGNSATTVQTIVYVDNTPPAISNPGDKQLTCGASSAPANTGTATATDNCGGTVAVTYTDESIAANCTGQAGIKRTWKATDACGNSATTVQTIVYVDNTPPVISCSGDKQLTCGASSAPANTGTATATDNCGGTVAVTYTDESIAANCTGQAGIKRTWKATDACGNSATTVQTIVYVDNTPPVISCNGDKQLTCGASSAPANTGTATATDNCGGTVAVTYTDESLAANCTGQAGIKRTWKATDACGNSATTVQTIVYVDNTPPVISCSGDKQLTCGASSAPANTGTATATDNCGGTPVITYTDESIAANCTGQAGIKRTWKATDACGNSATTVQTIVYVDNTPPAISNPGDKQLTCGASSAPANTGTATATDNCGGTPIITYTDESIAANCTGQAGIKRTWKATDACGNSATTVQMIAYVDNTPPVISCTGDKQLTCGASSAPANTGTATATDNCGGTPVITYTDESIAANCTGLAGIKRTWKATDACGNSATTVQTIVYVDNTPPVISCNGDKQLTCGASPAPANTGTATATDNCGGTVAVTYTDESIAANCTGQAGIKRTWKATDACGNSATTVQTIVYVDNTPPVISCNGDKQLPCGASPAPANTGTATATDNCGGIVAVTYTDESLAANCTGQAGIKRTWKATDACGNSATTVQTIVNVDNTPPVISCNGDKQLTCGASSAPANTGTATATDNCGGAVAVTYIDESLAANCTGQAGIKRTWKATDACGNSATTVQMIVYVDNTPPVISCNGDKQLTCGASSAPANTGTATATDNCGGAVAVTYIDESLAANCTGQAGIKRTWKATDACGNSATTVQTIVYVDNTPPVISCNGDKQLTCGASSAPANTGTATATDNCGGTVAVTYTDESIAANCTGQAGIKRTWKATDACGNSATTVQTIVYVDNTPPVISCSGDKQLTCGASSAPANTGTATATDNCGGTVAITYTDESIAANCTGQAGIKRTWKATDACGNSATTVQTIVYVDNTPPVISCSGDKQLTCGASSAPANTGTATATDNCGGTVAVTYTDETLAANCTGQAGIKRTWKATDACGNSATTVQMIVYVDNTPPVLTCLTNIELPCGSSTNPLVIGFANATDNCSNNPVIATYTDEATAPNCTGQAGVKRTWKATDACGNTTTVVQTIVFKDVTPPSLSCPAGLVVGCGSLIPQALPASLIAGDNCGGPAIVTLLSEMTNGLSCGPNFNITRTFMATDACGNTATCSQVIGVLDQLAPTLTCPANLTVSCTSQMPAVDISGVQANDNCSIVVKSHAGDAISNKICDNRFVLTRTYKATDGCNNSATCSQKITVFDQLLPSITCPANTTVSCASEAPANDFSAIVATDNCGSTVTKSLLSDLVSGKTCDNRFTTTRTYKVTDACGNSATCSQKITVYDQTPPTITCPAATTVACVGQVPAPSLTGLTTSDNCGNVSMVCNGDLITNKICDNRFTISRTYKATDACGNSAMCTQKITVNDQTAPTVSCAADITVNCANLVPLPNLGAITASDNCTGACSKVCVGDVIGNKTCANRYLITRTYKVSDACSNTATCIQKITVNDQTPPNITCPTNITVTCANLVPAMNLALATASDNCDGAATKSFGGDLISNQTCDNRYLITRTYVATDACGNISACSQQITVKDQTPPTISCPAATTVTCSGQVAAINPGAVTITDNCGGSAIKSYVGDVVSNQTCDNRYLLTRTYQVADACGNSATCKQLITVNDQTPPTVTCPAATTVSCAGQVPAINVAALLASDNCSAVTKECTGDVVSNKTCDNRFTLTRTYKVSDACGKTATCTQTISVNDQTAPTIACPANTTVTCASLVPTVNLPDLTVSDNCGGTVAKAHQGDVISNKTCDNRFLLTRTYKATDACGKTATCTQTISVNDQTAPTVACPANTTVSCVGQVPTASPTSLTVSDNCSGTVTTSLVGDAIGNQTCASRYLLTRTYKATDACGKTATCAQLIRVDDQSGPSGQCPQTAVVSCAEDLPCSGSDPAVLAMISTLKSKFSDACGGALSVKVDSMGPLQECSPADYTFGRTFTFKISDACGNATPCSVRFSGSCNCTYTQGFWGNANGQANGLTATQILDTLMQMGPITVGDGSSCGFTVSTRQCIQGIMPAGGTSSPLGPNYQLNCTQKLKNTLVGQLIAVQLNIRYNLRFRNQHLENFSLNGSCVLDSATVKALGLTTNSTLKDLIDLSNAYLAAVCKNKTYPNGFGGQLTTALTAFNEYWDNCQHNDACHNDDAPAPGDNTERNAPATPTALEVISLAPNPAFSVLNVAFRAEAPMQTRIRVFDVKGLLMLQQPIEAVAGDNATTIDVSGLPPGVYWLALADSRMAITRRFVVYRL